MMLAPEKLPWRTSEWNPRWVFNADGKPIGSFMTHDIAVSIVNLANNFKDSEQSKK